jgi:hypothetical protein
MRTIPQGLAPRLAGTVFFGLFLPLFAACAAPTLPLPPPSALVSTPDESGNVTITGMGRPNAVVMVFNESTERGVIVVADGVGNYTARIEASGGETLTIWQMVGTDTSQLLSRTVPLPDPT